MLRALIPTITQLIINNFEQEDAEPRTYDHKCQLDSRACRWPDSVKAMPRPHNHKVLELPATPGIRNWMLELGFDLNIRATASFGSTSAPV